MNDQSIHRQLGINPTQDTDPEETAEWRDALAPCCTAPARSACAS